MISGGTLAPGTSFVHELGIPGRRQAAIFPQSNGCLMCAIRFMNRSRIRRSKTRLRDDVLRPRFDLPIEAPKLLIHVDRAGVGSDGRY